MNRAAAGLIAAVAIAILQQGCGTPREVTLDARDARPDDGGQGGQHGTGGQGGTQSGDASADVAPENDAPVAPDSASTETADRPIAPPDADSTGDVRDAADAPIDVTPDAMAPDAGAADRPDSCDANGACTTPGSILWARSASSVFLLGVAEGTTGVLVTGILSAPANLGGALLAPVGRNDVAIAEFAIPDGAHLYSSRFGGGSPTGSGDVIGYLDTADFSGSPLIQGASTCDPGGAPACDQVDVGQGLVTPGGGSGGDGFVGRYSVVSGKANWVARLKGPGDDQLLTSTVGSNGSLFVAGYFDQDTTLTSGSDSRNFKAAGDRDILIAELSPSTGQIGMTKTFGGPTFEEPQSIAWTGSQLIVAGTFSGKTTFGTKDLNSAGDFDVWVAKLTPNDGSPVWAVSLGGMGRDVYPFIAVDSSGDIYVAGTVDGQTMFGTHNVGGAGGLDIFVAKLRNADGAVVWATSFGSTGNDGASDIAINSSGELLVIGNLAGPLAPGGSSPGGADAILASFKGDGTRLWTKVIGTSGADLGGVVASGTDAFYATVNLGADIGATIEGVPIMGSPKPTGLLLKIEP